MFGSRKNLMSRKDERELLRLGTRVFAEQFPNPDRAGCPPQDVLRAMAFRRQHTGPGGCPSDHLTVCSPCFRDYSGYRKQARQQMLVRTVLATAAVVIILISATLLWRHAGSPLQRRPEIVQRPPNELPPISATLDLRHLSAVRGEGLPKEARPQVTMPSGRLQLVLQLPIGSEEGKYEVALSRRSGEQIALTSGTAVFAQNVMTLKVTLDLSGVPPGRYIFEIRRIGAVWNRYEVEIH